LLRCLFCSSYNVLFNESGWKPTPWTDAAQTSICNRRRVRAYKPCTWIAYCSLGLCLNPNRLWLRILQQNDKVRQTWHHPCYKWRAITLPSRTSKSEPEIRPQPVDGSTGSNDATPLPSELSDAMNRPGASGAIPTRTTTQQPNDCTEEAQSGVLDPKNTASRFTRHTRSQSNNIRLGDLVIETFLANPGDRIEDNPVYRAASLDPITFVYRLQLYWDTTGRASPWILPYWAEIRRIDVDGRWEELE
jgi:hypothetical protein